jgi:hypothetical protein
VIISYGVQSYFEPRLGERFADEISLVEDITGEELAGAIKETIVEKNLIQTGAMLNSVFYYPYFKRVMVGQFYAVFIEFGTTHKAPRPFVGPNVDEFQTLFVQRLTAVFQQGTIKMSVSLPGSLR